MKKATADIHSLISRYRQGDKKALDEIMAVVYPELRRIAQNQMRGGGVVTIAPTALVHEAFLRLSQENAVAVNDRNHFLAVAAQCMRWILIDYAKAKRRDKRGGNHVRVEFDERIHVVKNEAFDLIDLDEALQRLSEQDPRLSQVVELRYLAGLSVEQTAEVMDSSPATVKRDWALAKAWLQRELSGKE